MTFHDSIHRHLRQRRLAQRMAALNSARRKLMTAASRTTGPRADAIADLAAYCDVVLSYLWPVWRKG